MFVDATLVRFKRPLEEFRLQWDFVNDLETGDSVTGQEVKVYDQADGSDQTATMLENPQILGSTIRVQLQGGTDGHTYNVQFQATSVQGDKWRRVVRVGVRA